MSDVNSHRYSLLIEMTYVLRLHRLALQYMYSHWLHRCHEWIYSRAKYWCICSGGRAGCDCGNTWCFTRRQRAKNGPRKCHAIWVAARCCYYGENKTIKYMYLHSRRKVRIIQLVDDDKWRCVDVIWKAMVIHHRHVPLAVQRERILCKDSE